MSNSSRTPVSWTLASFTPAEVARITHLSAVMQRDWRQRGFLAKSVDAQARFDPFSLAEIWIMKMLSDAGLGPQKSKSFARRCGEAVVHRALSTPGSFDLNLDEIQIIRARAQLFSRAGISQDYVYESEVRTPNIFAGNVIWWPTTGDVEFDQDPLAQQVNDELRGVAVVLDLKQLSRHLIKRAGRPLASAEFEPEP